MAGVAVWWWLARRHRPGTPSVVWTQAMPVAARTLRGRLEALLHAPRQSQAQITQVCEQLGDIVRDLARQRHGIPGRRLTTSELMERLEQQGVSDTECRVFRTLLETCDRVKFAGAPIPADVLSNRLSLARRLLSGLNPAEESA